MLKILFLFVLINLQILNANDNPQKIASSI